MPDFVLFLVKYKLILFALCLVMCVGLVQQFTSSCWSCRCWLVWNCNAGSI